MKPFVCKVMGAWWCAMTPGCVTVHESHAEAFAAALDRALVSEATA